ncbi:keratin, type I cytoskeletal 10-like [Montipora foliosa]|uniref:keratin, type I cytoskeletal 10-like n=1 Tax=Montipora foliosa TaxID=591990 RepID=UPI0035F148DE
MRDDLANSFSSFLGPRQMSRIYALLLFGLIICAAHVAGYSSNDTQLKVTFTTLGSKGRTGPRDTSQYHGTPLEGKVQLDNGIQTWIVPTTGMYSVTAWGASGGNGIKEGGGGWTLGGKGAKIKGLFKLTAGEKLKILVGQQGISNVQGRGVGAAPPGGGGGGTFVIKGDDKPLIIAGGGGGGAGFESVNTSLNGDNGQKTENGTRHGGNNGLGGRRSPNPEGSGRGGYSGNGESSGTCSGGNGGDGGQSLPGVSDGGFGGGGAAASFPGGGGGYSGGGVEELSYGGKVAGGGGSYNRGTEQDNSEGLNFGDGEVMITLIDYQSQKSQKIVFKLILLLTKIPQKRDDLILTPDNFNRASFNQFYKVISLILWCGLLRKMMYHCVLKTAFMIIGFLCLGSAQIIQQSGLFSTKENTKIHEGDMIKLQETQSFVACTHSCLSDPLCTSFNYDTLSRNTGFCELYKDSGMARLIDERGWVCGHLLEKQKTVKPPAQCKTWRTQDGGCCVFPFIYQGSPRESCVFDGQSWCSLTENYDLDKLKGTCEDFNVTFTTLGAKGRGGPTNVTGYRGTTLQDKVKLERGIQMWQVPRNGTYVIEAWGASGADSDKNVGGKGAYIKGTFNLTRGILLQILVGQTGMNGTTGKNLVGGGGGGTFVVDPNGIALIIAGGGGGGGGGVEEEGDPGQKKEDGSQHGGQNGTGGKIREEGNSSPSFEGGAGGGFFTGGESGGKAEGGRSFQNGGEGGESPSGSNGGFGGGGAGMKYPGAGGGYSGGSVFMKGDKTIAGGGGSLNRGANQVKEAGANEGHGRVTITLVL